MSIFKTLNLFKAYQPSEELAYERYMRLCGLFNCIPDEVRTDAKYAGAAREFDVLRSKIEEEMVDKESRSFKQNDAADNVHNLYLLFIQIALVDYLSFAISAMRDEYRETVGDQVFATYDASATVAALKALKTDAPEYEKLLRADATFLANETRRYFLLQNHVQNTKRYLINAVTKFALTITPPLLAIALIFIFCDWLQNLDDAFWTNLAGGKGTWLEKCLGRLAHFFWIFNFFPGVIGPSAPPTPTGALNVLQGTALIALAGIAGVAGAYISVLSRIQGVEASTEVSRNILSLKNSDVAVRLAPLFGMLSAMVLSLILAGGFVKGTLFPDQYSAAWYLVMNFPNELAKWLVWCFVAGFSERLVPDMIDRITAQSKEQGKPMLMPNSAPNGLFLRTEGDRDNHGGANQTRPPVQEAEEKKGAADAAPTSASPAAPDGK